MMKPPALVLLVAGGVLVAGELLLSANLSLATVMSSASPTPQPLKTRQTSQ